MNEAQAALLEKAHRALSAAVVSLDRDDLETAINRAYYAVFYAAQAALVVVDEYPKTHNGVLRRFQYHYVRTGKLPASTGEFLSFAFDLRLRADYDAFATFETQAAADLVDDAKQFVQTIDMMLPG